MNNTAFCQSAHLSHEKERKYRHTVVARWRCGHGRDAPPNCPCWKLPASHDFDLNEAYSFCCIIGVISDRCTWNGRKSERVDAKSFKISKSLQKRKFLNFWNNSLKSHAHITLAPDWFDSPVRVYYNTVAARWCSRFVRSEIFCQNTRTPVVWRHRWRWHIDL
jgi:hypothetical protein